MIDGQGGEPKIGGDAARSGTRTEAAARARRSSRCRGRPTSRSTGSRCTTRRCFTSSSAANGFIVWGVTIKTPSKSTNSAGTALTPSLAHNTDGIDPGEAASNGFIVCSTISDGDDQIAIKGGTTGVDKLTIAHNHFGAGHGMSIGSETNGGVSNVNVYDLSIDGTGTGLGGGSSNGIRIKSDASRGGLVRTSRTATSASRDLANPILLTPHYTTATGIAHPAIHGHHHPAISTRS